MSRLEITSRIEREHLRELLDLEEPAPRQRTTARMPAMTLSGLLTLRDEDVPPDLKPELTPLAVKLHTFGLWQLERMPRPAIVAVSFSATLLLLSILWRLF